MEKCALLCGPDCQHVVGCMNAGRCLRQVDGTKAPMDWDSYHLRTLKHTKISGYGPNTAMHMPCPCCGAANWLVFKILNTEATTERGKVCEECHRGFRAIYTRQHNSKTYEFVQFYGPDVPAWHSAKWPIRRLAR